MAVATFVHDGRAIECILPAIAIDENSIDQSRGHRTSACLKGLPEQMLGHGRGIAHPPRGG